MRDWRSGPQWDSRTLAELDGYRIRAVCRFCGHIARFDPRSLRRKQPRHYAWIAIGPRLRCQVCETKAAELHLEPVRMKKLPRRSNTVH